MKFAGIISFIAILGCVALHVAAQDACSQKPAVVGNCFAIKPRYTYYPDRGVCEQFSYGGCGGNSNNFVTRNECMAICGRRGYRADTTPKRRSPVCNEEPGVVGSCRGKIPRYTFDRTGNCIKFFYGGCGGTNNSFRTQEECVRTCKQ